MTKVKVFFYHEQPPSISNLFEGQPEINLWLVSKEVDLENIEEEMSEIERSYPGFRRWAGTKEAIIKSLRSSSPQGSPSDAKC